MKVKPVAFPALSARHARVDRDILADFKIGDTGTLPDDLTEIFMAHDDVFVINLPRRYVKCVEIAAANACGTNLDQDLVVPLDLRNRDFLDF